MSLADPELSRPQSKHLRVSPSELATVQLPRTQQKARQFDVELPGLSLCQERRSDRSDEASRDDAIRVGSGDQSDRSGDEQTQSAQQSADDVDTDKRECEEDQWSHILRDDTDARLDCGDRILILIDHELQSEIGQERNDDAWDDQQYKTDSRRDTDENARENYRACIRELEERSDGRLISVHFVKGSADERGLNEDADQ